MLFLMGESLGYYLIKARRLHNSSARITNLCIIGFFPRTFVNDVEHIVPRFFGINLTGNKGFSCAFGARA